MVIFMGVLYIVLHPRFITLEQQLWCIEKKYACRPRPGKNTKKSDKNGRPIPAAIQTILIQSSFGKTPPYPLDNAHTHGLRQ